MEDPQFDIIDSVFYDAQTKANALRLLTPINDIVSWQESVKKGVIPEFIYPEVDYEPNEVREVLKQLEIPEHPLKEIYEAKRRELLLQNELVEKRTDPKEVQRITKLLYGTPSEELIKIAESILQQPIPELQYIETAKDVEREFTEALKNLGLANWHIVFDPKHATTVYPAEKKITICKDRKFAQGEARRLRIHEIETHALRAHNGGQRPYAIFALGFPQYLATEEGLATYAEELNGLLDKRTLRKYAARVIATDFLQKGATMQDTFNHLTQYPAFAEAKGRGIWDIVLRIYRSGGYFKDHVYLEGYLDVKAWVERGGDVRKLWVGKIGLKDVPLLNHLPSDLQSNPPLLDLFPSWL